MTKSQIVYLDGAIVNEITYDEFNWQIVAGPNQLGYYHLIRNDAHSTCQHSAWVHGTDLGLNTTATAIV
jgi:hypothetical protein